MPRLSKDSMSLVPRQTSRRCPAEGELLFRLWHARLYLQHHAVNMKHDDDNLSAQQELHLGTGNPKRNSWL